MVDGNAAVAFFTESCVMASLEAPINVLRLSLHPDGMASRILNLGQWRAHILDRLSHQIAATGDAGLSTLHKELRGYPGAGILQHHDGVRNTAGRDRGRAGDRGVYPADEATTAASDADRSHLVYPELEVAGTAARDRATVWGESSSFGTL